MKTGRILTVVGALVLLVAVIPIAQSWAEGRDAPAPTHEWEITGLDGPTGVTLALGQQIQIMHKVRLSVVVQTDKGWTAGDGSEVDECVSISDTAAGDVGEVCAGATPVTFEFPVGVGPFDTCGRYEYEDVASFVTNDTGKTGEVRWITDVVVPCGAE